MIRNDREPAAAVEVLRNHIGHVEVIDVVRPAGGWGNLSFRVDTPVGSFVVTRCSATPEPKLRDMADLLIDLEKVGFPSPRLVPRPDGRLFSEWDGYPALVKHYIEGAAPNGAEAGDPSEFGELVARFHLATSSRRIEQPHGFGRAAFRTAEQFATTDPFAAWLGIMAGRFEAAIDPRLPSGLVHGDLVLDNMVRSSDGNLSIIDLEDMCRETLMFDLGMIIFTLAEADRWSEDLERTAVEGYERVRELESDETAAIPLFLSYAAAAIAFVRFRERRIDGGGGVGEGAWEAPQRIADAAWERFTAT